jgi:hypothetical protein
VSSPLAFHIGEPRRPSGISHDNGFGKPKRSPTGKEILLYENITSILNLRKNPMVRVVEESLRIVDDATFVIASASVKRFLALPDAIDAFTHFIQATGAARSVNYPAFLTSDPAGRLLEANARYYARRGAEKILEQRYLPDLRSRGAVTFRMTSSAIAMNQEDGGEFLYPQTENWQKTLGAHFVWLSATVNVSFNPRVNPAPIFHLVLTLHAEDRYNFNPGQKDIASDTPDELFGGFEESGLAKSYMNYGEAILVEQWFGRTVNIAQVAYQLPGTW